MTTTINIFKFEKDVEYFSAGETIFAAGDEGHCMYVVQDGIVAISIDGTVLQELEAGQVFGEMALVDDSPRSADAIAKTDCRVVPIDEDKFMSHVHRTPFFALQVMRIMSDRLRSRLQDISRLQQGGS